MKKYLLSFVLLCAFTVNAQQNQELKLDKSPQGRSLSDFFSVLRKKTVGGIGGGYQQASFFNPTFFNNVNNSAIKNKGGYEVSMFFNITPVMLDLAYFRSAFEVNSNAYYYDYPKKSTGMQGIDVYLSYAPLLPDWGKISEIITPYIGLGYQSAQLFVKDDSKSDSGNSGSSNSNSSNFIATYGVSSPMWKGGVRFNLGPVFIKGEYKQGLSLSKPEAMRLISISAGIKF